MNEQPSQTSKSFRLHYPDYEEQLEPSKSSRGKLVKVFKCNYHDCNAKTGREHDMKTRHWATHFPLAGGDGQMYYSCYYCKKKTRQKGNMKSHERVCPRAPHNMGPAAGLQKARRRRSVKKTAPSGKTASKTKGKAKQSAAHDARTDTKAALIHRRAMDDSLPALPQYPPIQPQSTVHATRKRKTESEAGPSNTACKKRKPAVEIVRLDPPQAFDFPSECPPSLLPPIAPGYPPQTMGYSPRPTIPKPRVSQRRSNRQRSDVAQLSRSTNHAPRKASASEDAHPFAPKSAYASDDSQQVMDASWTPQIPELGAYCPLTSSTAARQWGVAHQGDGYLVSGMSIGTARAEPISVGGSRARDVSDNPAMYWPLEAPPIYANPAVHQGAPQFSSWNNIEAAQITPSRDVVGNVPQAVDGSSCAPIYETEHSPIDVDSPVASSAISLPSLPTVMATLASLPQFFRLPPERSGRTHWQATPLDPSPSPQWKQGHDMPIYPSSNIVDQLYTEAVVSGITPASFSDPAQIQRVSSSAHTLGRRGSSSSGSSSDGSTYYHLMTPTDHSINMTLQPEAYYYENTNGSTTHWQNPGVTIVDPRQMLRVASNYSLDSAGYIGQPYSEMGPNYGYDT